MRGWWRSLFAARPEPGAGAKNNEDLEAFDRLPKLPSELDPLTRRAPKRVLRTPNLDGVFAGGRNLCQQNATQLKLLRSHAVGVGEPLPARVVQKYLASA